VELAKGLKEFMSNSDSNFKRMYLVQLLQYSATFLKLNKEQESLLYYFCNYLVTSNDLKADFQQLVKISEISALALKLKHAYEYISSPKLQFINISEYFKKQTNEIIYDLLNFLNKVDLNKLKDILLPGLEIEYKEENNLEIETKTINKNIETVENPDYKKFEKRIIQQIKYYDEFLTRLYQQGIDLNELMEAVDEAKKIEEEIEEHKFEVLANIQNTFSTTLELIFKNTLPITNDTIESLRACLIVIAAVIKNKDIDLSYYLSRVDNLKKIINSFHIS
jgi:hypothetical protein